MRHAAPLVPVRAARRMFTAGVAAAVAAALVPAPAGGAAPTGPARQAATAAVTDPANYVDPLVGTANAGNTFPGAVAPFGMFSFSPTQTRYYGPTSGANAGRGTLRPSSPSGYQYNTNTINGFSLTHISGAGCNGASADIPIMPITTDVTTSPNAADTGTTETPRYQSTFTHANETATPGSYRVTLDSGIDAQLAATARTGSARFIFPAGGKAGLLIRSSDSLAGSSAATVSIDPAGRTVSGSVTSGNFCGPYTGDKILQRSYYTLYFTIAFDQAFTAVGTWKDAAVTRGSTSAAGGTGYTGGLNPDGSAADGYAPAGKGSGGYVMFQPGATVNARVGISYVSAANAGANLAVENPAGGVDTVAAGTRAAWNAELGRIAVGGGTRDELSTFYTALYHSLLHPNLISDVNRQYPGFDGKPHQLPKGQNAQYATFSGWDVYRSQIQLLTLLDPQRGSDIAASLLNQAEANGGVWDRWTHNTGGTHVMVGDPSAVALAGITAFGGADFPVQRAFDSLAKAARVPTQQDLSRAGWNVAVIGQRPSLDQFLKYGFYPEGCNAWGCPNETLEMAAADAGLAGLAQYLGDGNAYREFSARSQAWQQQFNPAAVVDGDGNRTGYVQSRLASGAWVSGFDPGSSSGFVEGTGAQYLWMVQHNPAGLIDAIGGPGKAVQRLDSFFKDADGNWVLIGPWDGTTHANMDNEPSIGAAWLYNYTGTPWKTQQTVRETIKQLWIRTKDGIPGGPDGIPGNDDLGQMSSWLVFAAMGLYPQNPSRADLTFAAPLFSSITVRRANGRTITIDAPGAAIDQPYISTLSVNGTASSKNYLPATALKANVSIGVQVAASANTRRGTAATDAPPSQRFGETPFTASLSSPTTTAVPGGLSRPVALQVYRLNTSRSAPRSLNYTVDAPAGLTPERASGSVVVGATGAVEIPIAIRVDDTVRPGSYPVTVTWSAGGEQLGSATLTVVVAKAAKTLLQTSFEPGQPQPTANQRRDSAGFAEYCCGIGGTESKAQGGFGHTGGWATIYSARAVQPGNHAENVLLSGDQTGQLVRAGDTLSYAVQPQETGGPFGDYLQNLSQYVSVDLLFTDGTRLSDTGVTASNGAALTPQAQGAVLPTDEWTVVQVGIPEAADGKTIAAVTLRFGTGDRTATAGKQDGYLRGWVDDVALSRPLPPLTVTGAERIAGVAGSELGAELAVVVGGNPGDGGAGYRATVDWGDGSPAAAADVQPGADGSYRVTGRHTYAAAGSYTATVTVLDADGVRRTASVPVTVTAAAARQLPRIAVRGNSTATDDLGARAGATSPGSTVTVTGSGFLPGERVLVKVDTAGAEVVTATASAAGTVSARVPVPAGARGYLTSTAFGQLSATTAVAALAVR